MQAIYKIADATTWRELDGEIVALDTEAAVYYSIGGIGTSLWPSLVTGTTRDALVEEVVGMFGEVVTREQAEVDVDAFVDSCTENGLIDATNVT